MLPQTAGPASPLVEGVTHALGYYDAVTGDRLGDAEAASLRPVFVRDDGSVLNVAVAQGRGDASLVASVPLDNTRRYRVRIDGASSLRYFGCEAEFEADGAPGRQFRVLLVPRQREVLLRVRAGHGARWRALSDETLSRSELRAAAASEREVEVHRGGCDGASQGAPGRWCVRSLAESPGPMNLSVYVPGFGLNAVTVDATHPARALFAEVSYEGQVVPRAVLQLGASAGVYQGDGLGGVFALNVTVAGAGVELACPMQSTCLRPYLHLGGFASPYRRGTFLVGPGEARVPDTTVTGSLLGLEVGGGLTVYPGGTDDKLRFSAGLSMLYAGRDAERDAAHRLTLSPAAAQAGLGAELQAAYRLAGSFQVFAGARFLALPRFGSEGRQFSYLGDAGVRDALASMVQFALSAGLGVDL